MGKHALYVPLLPHQHSQRHTKSSAYTVHCAEADRLTSIKNHLQPSTMSDKIVLPSEGAHGERHGTATATCYCGAVQIEVPTEGEGLVDTFICHCTDCRKITARYFGEAAPFRYRLNIPG